MQGVFRRAPKRPAHAGGAGSILPQFLSLRGREYRGGRFCLPACPDSPDCLFCGKAATVPSAAYFFCCARKSRQKEALEDALYCALPRAIFWPLRGLNALFRRRIAIIPIAYGADECTTRSCGQTASISVLLISGILDRLWSCTAPCRGRCPHRPFCPVAPDCR